MTTLLSPVEAALAIHAHRRSAGLLDGEYASVHRGRSLEFDDLREYVPGDDVKDLDWKATARSPHPLVRRYVAVRKHTIVLVAATGRGLAALATPDTTKGELLILAAGIIGSLAVRHGDLVGVVAGDAADVTALRPGATRLHLEGVLRSIDARCAVTGAAGDIRAPAEFALHSLRRRAVVVLLTDGTRLDAAALACLRRLAVPHELLHLDVGSLSATDPALGNDLAIDVDSKAAVPPYLRRDAILHREAVAAQDEVAAANVRALRRLGIASERITRPDDAVPGVFRLLDRHRRARG